MSGRRQGRRFLAFLWIACGAFGCGGSGATPRLAEIPRPNSAGPRSNKIPTVILEPPGGSPAVSEVIWSSSQSVAARFSDGRFAVWRLGNNAVVARVDSPTNDLSARCTAMVSPDRLLTGTTTGVILWNVSSNPARIVSRSDCGPISALAVSSIAGRELALLAGRDDGTILRLGFTRADNLDVIGSRKLAGAISRLETIPARREVSAILADGTVMNLRSDLAGEVTQDQSARAIARGNNGEWVVRLLNGPRVEVTSRDGRTMPVTFSPNRPANSMAMCGGTTLILGGDGCLWILALGAYGVIPGETREVAGYRGSLVVAVEPSGTRIMIGDGSGKLEVAELGEFASRGVPISLDDVSEFAFRPEFRLDRPRPELTPITFSNNLQKVRKRLDRGEMAGLRDEVQKFLVKEGITQRDRAEAFALQAAIEARLGQTARSELAGKITSARDLFRLEGATDREADMEFWLGWLATPSLDSRFRNRDSHTLAEALTPLRKAARLYRSGSRPLERQALVCETARAWVELNLGDVRSASRSSAPVLEAARADPVLSRIVEIDRIAATIAASRGDWARSAAADLRVLNRLMPGERLGLRREAALSRAGALANLGSWNAAADVLAEDQPNDPEWTIRRAVCRKNAGRPTRFPGKPIEGDPVAAHLRFLAANPENLKSTAEALADLAIASEGYRKVGLDDLADEAKLARAEAMERLGDKAQAATLFAESLIAIEAIDRDPARRTTRPILETHARIARGLSRMESELGRPLQSLAAWEAGRDETPSDSTVGLPSAEFALAESLRDARARLESLGGPGAGPEAASAAIEIQRLRTALAGRSGATRSRKTLDVQSFGLADDEAILVISRVGPETIVALSLRNGAEPEARTLLIRPDEVDRDIARWRKSLGDGGRPFVESHDLPHFAILSLGSEPASLNRKSSSGSIEGKLYETLARPLVQQFPTIKRLYLVPDDSLSAMPFEVIGKETRLGDLVSIRLLDRATSLPLLRDPARPERPTNHQAVFISTKGDSGTKARVSAMKASGWTTRTIIADEATADRLLGDNLSSCEIVHLIAPTISGESGLALNPGKWPTRRNGEVSAADLASIPLKARVLVLDVGDKRGCSPRSLRELAHAGLETGAESVLLTLWSHPEESSSRFFKAFYEAMASGRQAAEAVEMARSAVARDPKFRDPVHWAGYAYYGP